MSEETREQRIREKLADYLAAPSDEGAEGNADSPPPFLATWLEQWRVAEGWDRAALAGALGTTETGLDRLALCLAPRETQFREDVTAIAAECGCDAGRLRSALRKREVMGVFAAEPDAQRSAASQRTARNGPAATGRTAFNGLLLAARDRDEESSEQSEAAEPEDAE